VAGAPLDGVRHRIVGLNKELMKNKIINPIFYRIENH